MDAEKDILLHLLKKKVITEQQANRLLLAMYHHQLSSSPVYYDIYFGLMRQASKVAYFLQQKFQATIVKVKDQYDTFCKIKHFARSYQKKVFQFPLDSHHSNQLRLLSYHNDLLVRPSLNDQLKIVVYYKGSKSKSSFLNFLHIENRYFLEFNADLFEEVYVEAYVPPKMFTKIYLESENGNIVVSRLHPITLDISCSIGSIFLIAASCKKLTMDLNCSKLFAYSFRCADFSGEYMNYSAVIIQYSDISKMELTGENTKLLFKHNYFLHFENYFWKLISTHQPILLYLPRLDAYSIFMMTQGAKTHLHLDDFSMLTNKDHEKKGMSRFIHQCSKKVQIYVANYKEDIKISH